MNKKYKRNGKAVKWIDHRYSKVSKEYLRGIHIACCMIAAQRAQINAMNAARFRGPLGGKFSSSQTVAINKTGLSDEQVKALFEAVSNDGVAVVIL